MLLIGIDEAGYGPVLGPLSHGLCVIRIEAEAESKNIPNLWNLWAPTVAKHSAKSTALVVDDSKKIFSGPDKFFRLFHSVRSFLETTTQQPIENLRACFENLLDPKDQQPFDDLPWKPDWTFKNLESAQERQPAFSRNTLQELFKTAKTSLLLYRSRALSARDFNIKIKGRANKAEVNWSIVAQCLLTGIQLAEENEPVFALIDRQGGRKFYAGPLGAAFPGTFVQILQEEKEHSQYSLCPGTNPITVSFMEKADSKFLPTALASMSAKLTREIFMEHFNAYFQQHQPELKPTAGYYQDAQRFLNDTQALRKKLKLQDEDLIRKK